VSPHQRRLRMAFCAASALAFAALVPFVQGPLVAVPLGLALVLAVVVGLLAGAGIDYQDQAIQEAERADRAQHALDAILNAHGQFDLGLALYEARDLRDDERHLGTWRTHP